MDEEKARLEAEARRQRILDAADTRMDRVSGLVGSSTEKAEGGGGGEEPPPAEKKSSGSSKMAAMRKRRFRKTAAKDESSSTATVATETTPKVDNTAKAATVETKKEATVQPVVETNTEAKPAEAVEGTTTKKYMGVAKMRRKMIKEKQKKKEEQEADQVPVAIPQKFSKLSTAKPLWPLVMHLLTVFFLFFAGFEVGLQQSVIEYRDDLTIHETLAPQQELRLLNQGISLSSFSPTPTIVKKDVTIDDDNDKKKKKPPKPYRSKDQDEFGANEEVEEEENLDPWFGVDLDALTEGPGLFMMMGRFAVRVHRMILSITYYLPIRLWNNLLSLIASPPVLCLASLLIRQISNLLGGKLPQAAAEEGKTSTQQQDIMATIKNAVTGFLGKAFPTATKAYEAWTHLRSDMYVVMGGLFFGMVWHHYLSSIPLLPTGDEL